MAESFTTSSDRYNRPIKKRALSPASKQAADVEALFANPDAALKEPRIPRPQGPAPPPEIVTNVQGSSAGAGSGEFHVYKASRRREYERLRIMEEESKQAEEDAKYEKKMDELRARDELKTERNRARREKLKQKKGAKGAKGGLAKGGTQGEGKAKLKANGLGAGGLNKDTAMLDAEVNGAPVVEDQGILINDEDG